MSDTLKPLFWIASSQRDIRACPDDVKATFGFALHMAQSGGKHSQAKPLRGFGGAGVLEVVEDHEGGTYRGGLHGAARWRRVRAARLPEEVEVRASPLRSPRSS